MPHPLFEAVSKATVLDPALAQAAGLAYTVLTRPELFTSKPEEVSALNEAARIISPIIQQSRSGGMCNFASNLFENFDMPR